MKPAQKIVGFVISFTLLVWSVPGAFGFDYEPHNGEWCTTCHDMVNCSTPNIYCVPSTITTTNSGDKTVVFTSSDSQVRGEAPYDGICEVCHTGTNYHRNSPSGDHTHFADQKCTSCHLHGPMVMISRNLCYTCHGGNPGDAPEGNPPMFTSPSGQSHNTHTKINSRGPNPALDCNNCHDTSDYSTFADGKPISTTTVCDICHSPGGTYDGVDDAVIGAKNNWTAGAYSGNNLASGKEKWCAGCHDENPSVMQGISAPNIAGEEGANTNYGIGYGYYKTGHGLETGTYPASGAPGANMQCSECHDSTSSHIDGEHRTYIAASSNYQEGYRLKDVAGGLPMEVPRTDVFTVESDFALCFQCHDSDMYLNTENLTTNFVEGVSNRHRVHLNSGGGNMNKWDSDWDGAVDSTMSCIACHNVHGSPSPRMIRHGELISDPGTTNKVPSIDFQYLTEYTYPALMDSSGGMIRSIGVGPGNVAKNGICVMCHADFVSYSRTPEDLYPPEIIFAYGQIGSNILNVTFSEGVYSDTGESGDLTEGDFTLTDIDDERSISSVSHNAGDDFAILTLSSALDPSLDIGTDLLAAASSASIYDASDNAMGIDTVTISDDIYVPSLSISIPENGASSIALNSELSFTLADSESGVDWSTFSIQLSGNSGYAKSYSELDTSIVSKNGPISSYRVKVKPDTFFGSGETITVTVSVDDFAGNSLVSPVWSFTAAGGPIWETPALVHEPEQFGSPNNLIDGNLATGNSLGSGIPANFDHFVTYQLDSDGDFYSVSGIRSYGGAPGTAGEWEVYVSKDGYTFTQVVDGWSVGSESQWYENNFSASDNVRYLRFNHRHGGAEGSDTAFEFQFKGTPVDNPIEMGNSIPNLSWTGETGYINDGVNPDSGTDPTDFEFRINYTDADNDAPGIIQVWVDTDDNGIYTYSEKFSMTETDSGDTDFTDGKLYTMTITLNNAGDGSLNYRFLATDSIDIAGGDPTDNNIVIVLP